jgi:hypothetical protein
VKKLKIWTKEEFEDAVNKSQSIQGALLRLGDVTRSYNTFHRYEKFWNVDTSHFCGQVLSGKSTKGRVHKIPLEQILVKNSTYHSGTGLKNRLLDANLIKNECSECKLVKWNGKNITLQLDHINGDHWDHRLENLRILCPNCHSQTETYCTRGVGSHNPRFRKCKCGSDILYSSNTCRACSKRNKKIMWPNNNWIIEALNGSNFLALSKQLGVSDVAIRNHLKREGIDVKSIRTNSFQNKAKFK